MDNTAIAKKQKEVAMERKNSKAPITPIDTVQRSKVKKGGSSQLTGQKPIQKSATVVNFMKRSQR